MIRHALLLAVTCFIAACEAPPARIDADVIVIGAGIAGISAALEASTTDVNVIVIERSSMAGGHAVQAGGFALIDTPLQQQKGHNDSPDLAYRDLMAWGEDADAEWVRQFVDRSRTDIYDWLTAMGVKFNVLIDTPEGSVPRFHFAGGKAINAVVPMLREALDRSNIHWLMNSSVEKLIPGDGGIIRVQVSDTRSGTVRIFTAASIVIATGGFQSNLELVRRYWPTDSAPPTQLLIGSGHNANGDGMRMAGAIGAMTTRLNDQVTFFNGLQNPRQPTHGLNATNPAAIWVNANGERFVNEAATTKVTEAAALKLSPLTHWMIFDAQGLRDLRIRDADWLEPATIVSEILDNPKVAGKADTITALATQIGLPPDQLQESVTRYNAFVAGGHDEDFQRFGPQTPVATDALTQPPYYALQLWPMTRKNLGGLTIDSQAQTINSQGNPVRGLFAAGEVTGVAGINGSHGGSGTFLAPSVLTGRIAGRSAATHATQTKTRLTGFDAVGSTSSPTAQNSSLAADDLDVLVASDREGYWHFEQSHRVVLERGLNCDSCHTDGWPTEPAVTTAARLKQLDSCTTCH